MHAAGVSDSPGTRLIYRLELFGQLGALHPFSRKIGLERRYLRLKLGYLRLKRCYLRLERFYFSAQTLLVCIGISHFYRCISERFRKGLVCRSKT